MLGATQAEKLPGEQDLSKMNSWYIQFFMKNILSYTDSKGNFLTSYLLRRKICNETYAWSIDDLLNLNEL